MEHCVRRPILLKFRIKGALGVNDCGLTEVTPGYLSPSTEAREFTALCDFTLHVVFITNAAINYKNGEGGYYVMDSTDPTLYLYINDELAYTHTQSNQYVKRDDFTADIKTGDTVRLDFQSKYATNNYVSKCIGVIMEAV